MISLFPERGAPVLFEAELDSTNTRLKAMAAYAEPGTVVAAGRQTGGRGRLGRSFASPPGGVYLSMLLAPAADLRACMTLTPTAAVAVRRALKKVCGLGADIKWPNDLQFGGKKLCGILTESVSAGGSFKLIIGIGVNLNTSMDELPPELHDTACSVYSVTGRSTPAGGRHTRDRGRAGLRLRPLDRQPSLGARRLSRRLRKPRAPCASRQHMRRGSLDCRRFRPAHLHGRGGACPRLQRRNIVRIKI